MHIRSLAVPWLGFVRDPQAALRSYPHMGDGTPKRFRVGKIRVLL